MVKTDEQQYMLKPYESKRLYSRIHNQFTASRMIDIPETTLRNHKEILCTCSYI